MMIIDTEPFEKISSSYALLREECTRSLALYKEEAVALERCFRVAGEYCTEAWDWWEGMELDAPARISFFKTWMPRFNAEATYYGFRLHACLQVAAISDIQQVHRYWTSEYRRLPRFRREHASFCAYYEKGATYKDRHWFYPNRDKPGCMHSSLAAHFIAHKRYHYFVRRQLGRPGSAVPTSFVDKYIWTI